MALGLYFVTQCTAALLLLTLSLNVAISICTGNENVFFCAEEKCQLLVTARVSFQSLI